MTLDIDTGLLIACVALSLIAVVLLVFLLFRGRRAARDRRMQHNGSMASSICSAEKLNGANLPTTEQLEPIATNLGRLSEEVAGLAHLVEEIPATQMPPAGASPVAFEHQILEAEWKQFCANKELNAAYESAARDSEWHVLLDDLTKFVPAELKPTFDAVIAPCREHRTIVQRIGFIPRIISGTFPRLENDADEARRTRELAGLLHCDATRLGFRFQSWVTETFLPFADLYLQRDQQARFEKRPGELQAGAALVRQLLRVAAVEPIEVTLGETQFDSARHIGRSTTNDPLVPDGVITGVIRNGFLEGQQLLRQPEVIVNRNR